MKPATEEKKKRDLALAIVRQLIETTNTKNQVTFSRDWGNPTSVTVSTIETHYHPGCPEPMNEFDFMTQLLHVLQKLAEGRKFEKYETL